MLVRLLRSFLKEGTIVLLRPGRSPAVIGQGAPRIVLRLTDRRAAMALGFNPDLALGELYMDGRLVIEEGNIALLLELLMRNLAHERRGVVRRAVGWLRRLLRPLHQLNVARRARKNVAHHYDLSARLYELFLDSDRQYSCAYFSTSFASLEDAQAAKKKHIAAKLKLDRQDLSVLDIGCGWGGMALELARETGARVMGITLSEEQIAVARERARKNGLAERCRFDLIDYRAVTGRFDRIVSVGMFEHVGARFYPAFFRSVARVLDDNGVMLLHFIGRSDGPGTTNPWIAKYIFPGGYAPALSEVLPAIEKSGLIVTDIEVLRLHYAQTLRAWRARFEAHRAEIERLYDARFCRMWEFYLAGSEATFRHGGQVVFQIQITKRNEAVPLTRDYMLEQEHTDRRQLSRAA